MLVEQFIKEVTPFWVFFLFIRQVGEPWQYVVCFDVFFDVFQWRIAVFSYVFAIFDGRIWLCGCWGLKGSFLDPFFWHNYGKSGQLAPKNDTFLPKMHKNVETRPKLKKICFSSKYCKVPKYRPFVNFWLFGKLFLSILIKFRGFLYLDITPIGTHKEV